MAAELYALVPEEFTAARNARARAAKADGDAELARAVQALRKPTAGAWLVNRWVREHGADVQQLLELGGRLRAAQGTLGADELRALDRQRRQLTRALAQQARDLGREEGRRVTDATTAEVEETLRSAMVDEVAGAALATGLLTDTFSSTGLDPVDLSRVVALAPEPAVRVPSGVTPTPAVDQARAAARERELADAQAAVAQADSALTAAQEALRRAGDEAAEAQRRREEVESRLEEARRRVHDLEDEADAAARAAEAATSAQEAARQEQATAAELAERRRAELEALRDRAGVG